MKWSQLLIDFGVIAFGCSVCLGSPTFAADLLATETSALSPRAGMTSDDIYRSYGKPDSQETKPGNSIETWHYGASMIFFAGGKVTGWTDRGELADHKAAHDFQPASHVAQKPFAEEGWHNAWTPEHKTESGEVIDTIIEDPPK